MTEEDIFYIKLKYDIITVDTSSWGACSIYPHSVLCNWVWRCVDDVIHLGIDNEEVALLYYTAQKYRRGSVSLQELIDAYGNVWALGGELFDDMLYYAGLSIDMPFRAPRCVRAAVSLRADINYWDIYINWLIEELYKYESKL